MKYQVPDQVGDPIHAWRIWFVVPEHRTSGELRLQSIVYGKLWEPKVIVKASCRASITHEDHEAPSADHKCGIYAVKTSEEAHRYYRDPTYKARTEWMEIWKVIGQVALWGKVIEGENGYRAQYAYPVKLMIPRILKGREMHLTAREVQTGLAHYCDTEIVEDTLRVI
jgi:hypothetical protein